MPGPTGEADLALRPREAVLCPGRRRVRADRLNQLAAVLAVGSHAVWPASAQALRERLPAAVRERISLALDWTQPTVAFDAVLHHGEPEAWLITADALAAQPGAIVSLTALPPGDTRIPLERLVVERSLSVNTAAGRQCEPDDDRMTVRRGAATGIAWIASGSVTIGRGARQGATPGWWMKILVIDVGGTNIKILASGQTEVRRVASGQR